MFLLIFIFIFILIFIILFYSKKRIEVQGHRGFRGLYPENTLPAFEQAIIIGVDVLELDLQLTKDNVVVIYHDKAINNLCKDGVLNKDIRTLTLEEVKKYDCGSIKNERFPLQKIIPSTKIPTLEELFQYIRNIDNKDIKVNIEIKTTENLVPSYNDEDVIIFTGKVIDILEKYNMKNRTIIQTEDTRCVKAVQSMDKNIILSFIINAPSDVDMVKIGKELNVNIISPEFILLNKDIVEKLHKNGFKVIPWTINNVDELKKMIDMKIDGVITDYPDIVLKYLKNDNNIIKKFNKLTNKKTYIKVFWIFIILHFIISYFLQFYNDTHNSLQCEIIRIFHHFIIPFVYVGIIAPEKYIPYILVISFITLISWLINTNKCILTQFEAQLCKTKLNTFHDISYYSSTKIEDTLVKNRIIYLFFIIILLVIRLNNKS